MNKTFSFRMKVNGVVGFHSFSAPCQDGYVITNCYCPKALLVGDSWLSAAITPQSGESETEFVQDCNNILAKASNEHKKLISGLDGVIAEHIGRCGRLIFGDMLIYIDCFSYLLKAVGFADAEIKRRYPVITKQMTDKYMEYIVAKDSRYLCVLPLNKDNNLYKTLCELTNQ